MDFNRFVSHRLEAYRERPRMWGSSNETIEHLALQLLEVEIRHYRPEAYDGKQRIIMDLYTKELARRYGSGSLPLYARAPELYEFEPKVHNFDQALYEICRKVRTDIRAELGLEPPFEILEIHRLEYLIHLQFPTAVFDLTVPRWADGVWTLDVTYANRWLVLTWQAPNRFSVSEMEGEPGYGEGPDEVFDTVKATLGRVVELLNASPPSV